MKKYDYDIYSIYSKALDWKHVIFKFESEYSYIE